MADEYIKRSDALTVIERFNGYLDDDMQYRIKFMLNRDCPAADVAPVVRGRWGAHSDRPDSLICSVCNCGFDMWKHDPHNYCPNCGAKMEEGAD